MEAFRRQQETSRVSLATSKLIAHSWRHGTRTAYNSAWRKWSGWCGERKASPFQAPVALVADYLAELFQEGKQFSTINGARSAIAALHVHVEGRSVGQQPMVKRVMAGVFNEDTNTKIRRDIGRG